LKYLLDTHTLLWWLDNSSTLSQEAKKIIANLNNDIFVSAATAWEISIKKSIGKLTAPDDFEDALKVNSFYHIPITIKDGLTIEKLPFFNNHKDPFDRMLVAQAINNNFTIITRDPSFKFYQVNLIDA
jgi:PIN domain nuclease of toxin-antitoxin system